MVKDLWQIVEEGDLATRVGMLKENFTVLSGMPVVPAWARWWVTLPLRQ